MDEYAEVDCPHWNINERELNEITNEILRCFSYERKVYMGLSSGYSGVLGSQQRENIYARLRAIADRERR